MKKIISFSLWGDSPKYLQGAIENIHLQKKIYPGWICRFYVHNSVSQEYVNNLVDLGAEIVIKTEEIGDSRNQNGMFWRFEILKDQNVERFIVRDADSRLSYREKNCVIDWEKSKEQFHIIRDHHYHSTKIMGGMWGATREFMDIFNYDLSLSEFKQMDYQNNYAADQEFLARIIYPLIKNSSCIHDDWDRYGEGARKIPHLRFNNEFIGQPVEL